MKTLTLEHLAPYLPYGLKCMYGCIMDVNNDHVEILNENNIQQVLNGYGTFVIQPILHPLSDLTKEIEHNGEKFVPRSKFFGNPLDYIITKNSYEVVQKILSWHFDVFGLIEQGLAIDINTLEK